MRQPAARPPRRRPTGKLADEIVPIARARAASSTRTAASAPDTTAGGPGRAEARLPRRRHGDRRHLLAADRRRRRGAGLHAEDFAKRARPARRWRGSSRIARRRLRARDHGHRPGRRHAARRWRAPASRSTTSTWSSSTRPSPARRWPASRDLGLDDATVNIDGGAHRARPPAGRHRRADHRQGGRAAASARAGATRWPPSASAAARASPPCWRRVVTIEATADQARSPSSAPGVMGAGIAAQVANAGVPVLLLDIVPRRQGADRNARRRRRHREDAQDRARAVHAPQRRQAGRAPATSSDDLARLAECDWIVEAMSSGSTSSRRSTRSSRRCASRAPSSPPTPRPSRWPTLIEGMPRRLRRGLPDHPLLQPAALHAAAGGRRRPATDPADAPPR